MESKCFIKYIGGDLRQVYFIFSYKNFKCIVFLNILLYYRTFLVVWCLRLAIHSRQPKSLKSKATSAMTQVSKPLSQFWEFEKQLWLSHIFHISTCISEMSLINFQSSKINQISAKIGINEKS